MLPLICGKERIQDLFSALYRQCNNLAFLSCNCGVTSNDRADPFLCACVLFTKCEHCFPQNSAVDRARGAALIRGLRERRIRTDCRAGLSVAVHLHNIFCSATIPTAPKRRSTSSNRALPGPERVGP